MAGEQRTSPRQRGRAVHLGALMAATALSGACLLDEDRCGDNQVAETTSGGVGACYCAPNAVPNPRGYDCIACGPNEEPRGTTCACVTGFTRDATSGACVPGMEPEDAGSDGATEGDASLPTGLGMPCTSSASCAGYEATFCPPVAPMLCLVEGCAAPDIRCPTDFTCCQIAALMSLARLGSICIPTETLAGGACPFSGTVVPE